MQEWFKDAKLGIFIHWDIYAVQRRGGESWPIATVHLSPRCIVAEGHFPP